MANKTIASIAHSSQQSIIICWLILFIKIIIMQFWMYITRTALLIKIPFLLLSRSVFFFLSCLLPHLKNYDKKKISVVAVCLLALGSYLWSCLSACICDQFLIQSIFFSLLLTFEANDAVYITSILHSKRILWNGQVELQKISWIWHYYY